MHTKNLSRREFLRAAGAAGVGMALSGCNLFNKSSDGARSSEGQKPSGDAVSLTMWYQDESHEPEYHRRIQALNERFNVTLKLELLPAGSIGRKLQMTLMAGSGFPDIVEQDGDNIPPVLIGEGELIPYIDLKPTLMAGPYADQVFLNRFGRYTKDGQIFAAPCDVHPVLLLYNYGAWQPFGIDPSTITTYSDLLAACEAVREQSDLLMEDGRPLTVMMDRVSGCNLTARMLDRGIWWTDKDGEPMINTPEMEEAASDWLLFRSYCSNYDPEAHIRMIKEGQCLLQACPDWLLHDHIQGTQDDPVWVADSPMRMMRLPGMSEDALRTTTWGGLCASVPKQSPVADVAVELLLYLYYDNGEEQLGERYLDTGVLPPVEGAWEDNAFHRRVEYLGGQIAGDLFIEAATTLPNYYEQWTTPLVRNAWDAFFVQAWNEELTLNECVVQAQTKALQDIEDLRL